MEIVRFDLNHLPPREKNLSLALGNFDAIHKGHQALFVETALGAEGVSSALIFARPYGGRESICSIEDKIRFCLSSRLDALYILENDDSLFALSAEEFIKKILLPLGTSRIVIGEDFRFGRDRGGGIDELKEHFHVEVLPLLRYKGEKISSSNIRKDIEEGRIDDLPATLGRRYEISGEVIHGLGNGHRIGFPTINLSLSFPYVLPKVGVYIGLVYLSGIAYEAIVNVGRNPTIGALDHPQIEAHLLEYHGDAYGKRAYVGFYSFLREEKTFDSLESLGEQLRKDEASCKAYFGGMC